MFVLEDKGLKNRLVSFVVTGRTPGAEELEGHIGRSSRGDVCVWSCSQTKLCHFIFISKCMAELGGNVTNVCTPDGT